MTATIDHIKRPFFEQLAFFKAKLKNLVPTAHWDDLEKSQHDRAFMVAGAAKADLLQDFVKTVDKAIEDGKSIEWFRKNFDAIVDQHGWAYTGERNWRTRVIYTTNLQTSYAAGRYAQLSDPKLLTLKPLWQYKHNDSVLYPRPEHVAWHNITLPPDHAFWRKYYPSNGFGCKCYVIAVSYEQAYKSGSNFTPPDGYLAGKGIDKGWDYAPGQTVVDDVKKAVNQKMANYEPEIATALKTELKTNGLSLKLEKE